MSERWLKTNEAIFVRDLVRDYCKVYAALEEQCRRFDGDGTVSYAVLRDLLGEAIRKGVFWRLKDTAHHLFRNVATQEDFTAPAKSNLLVWQYASSRLPEGLVRQNAVEAMIDWCIGYAFHECVKLKEDAFLQQHYANRYTEIQLCVRSIQDLCTPLDILTSQTQESIYRELRRILHVLGHARLLFVRYLAAHKNNKHLARLLYTESTLISKIFADAWSDLLDTLYQGNMARMYCLAARAFWEGGRVQEGLAVLAMAPQDEAGRALQQAMRNSALPPDTEQKP